MSDMKDDDDVVMGEVAEEKKGEEEEPVKMVLPCVDETLLAEMVSMGFNELNSRKALMNGAGNAEQAVQWVLDHENDANISDPIALVPENANTLGSTVTAVAKSFKCVETGRLFRTSEEVQAYAQRTGRTDFEETTEEKKPLTKEEKMEQIAKLKLLAATRRAEREEVEKVQDVAQEKERREAGKKSIQTKEELQKAQRVREAEKAKREKNAEKRERERLRAEIAKDKAERRARGGKLAGRLGVDGYAPSIDNNQDRRDNQADEEEKKNAPALDVSQLAKGKLVPAGTVKVALLPSEQVDKAIASISRYKASGDGGVALKTLGAYLRNAVTKGGEDTKFLAIPTDGQAFKKRVGGLVGGMSLLKAVGFVKNEEEGKIMLTPETREANLELLQSTLSKLEKAHADYSA